MADFDALRFAAHAGGVDGLWSNTIKDVADYRGGPGNLHACIAARFKPRRTYKGELSAASLRRGMNAGGLLDE